MKKFLPLLLALTMVFSLVACGNSNSTKNDQSGADQSNTPTQTPDAGNAEQSETCLLYTSDAADD